MYVIVVGGFQLFSNYGEQLVGRGEGEGGLHLSQEVV